MISGIVRFLEDDHQDREMITEELKKHGLVDGVDYFFYHATEALFTQLDEATSVVSLDNRIHGEVITGVHLMLRIREKVDRPLDIIICTGAITDELYQIVNNSRGYVVLKSDEYWAANLATIIMRCRERAMLLHEMEMLIKEVKGRDKLLPDERERIAEP